MEIVKDYEIKDVDDDERIIRILASDETLDRDGDIIRAKGWVTDNFMKTGSVLYGHNPSELPLARPIAAEVVGKKLYIHAKFADQGTSAFNDAVFSLIKQKILRGVSVSFKASEWKDIETGRDFNKQELIELSVTPIPANPNAMLQVKEYSKEVKEKLFNQVIKEVEAEQEDVNTELVEAKPESEDIKVNNDRAKLEQLAALLNKLK